jgi:cyclic pyranopterin phosphate synthase
MSVSNFVFSYSPFSNAYSGFYCMPSEGVELSPEGKLLTDQEIIRLASLFVDNGVTKIRLTGGEPSIRRGILELVRE